MFVLVVLSLTLCFIALMYLIFEKDESFKEALSFTIVLLVSMRRMRRRRRVADGLLLGAVGGSGRLVQALGRWGGGPAEVADAASASSPSASHTAPQPTSQPPAAPAPPAHLQVASIPIAIEIVCTTTLALGSRQLSAYGAIVTRLQAIEEMAGMNMLCSDKTGERGREGGRRVRCVCDWLAGRGVAGWQGGGGVCVVGWLAGMPLSKAAKTPPAAADAAAGGELPNPHRLSACRHADPEQDGDPGLLPHLQGGPGPGLCAHRLCPRRQVEGGGWGGVGPRARTPAAQQQEQCLAGWPAAQLGGWVAGSAVPYPQLQFLLSAATAPIQ